MSTNNIAIGTKITERNHPEWGSWTVTKTPTPSEDWYHIRGRSGEKVMFAGDLRFYDV